MECKYYRSEDKETLPSKDSKSPKLTHPSEKWNKVQKQTAINNNKTMENSSNIKNSKKTSKHSEGNTKMSSIFQTVAIKKQAH